MLPEIKDNNGRGGDETTHLRRPPVVRHRHCILKELWRLRAEGINQAE